VLNEQEKQEFIADMREGEIYHLKAMIAAAESVKNDSEAPQESHDEAVEIISLVNAEINIRSASRVAS
jgi:hypothetical protein